VVQVEAQVFQVAAEVQARLVDLREAAGVAMAAADLVQLRKDAKEAQAGQEVWEAAEPLVRATVAGEHAEAAGKWQGRTGHLEDMTEKVYHERVEVGQGGEQLSLRPLNPVVHACFAEVREGVVASSLVPHLPRHHSSGHRAQSF
jgi:hypothetical protein